jgi:uncharacterized protein (DUF952 family)
LCTGKLLGGLGQSIRNMQRVAYKIVKKELWQSQLKAFGKFIGTELDLQDGYIHLSAKEQLKETATKYFKGQNGLILIAVDLQLVQGEVKWEPSRNNQLFPHIYGAIDLLAVKWLRELLLTPDESDFIYPTEVFDSKQ